MSLQQQLKTPGEKLLLFVRRCFFFLCCFFLGFFSKVATELKLYQVARNKQKSRLINMSCFLSELKFNPTFQLPSGQILMVSSGFGIVLELTDEFSVTPVLRSECSHHSSRRLARPGACCARVPERPTGTPYGGDFNSAKLRVG